MDIVSLVLELMTSMFVLATKPFSLIRLSCVVGVKSLCIVIQTWIELLRAAIGLHFSIVQKIVGCIYSIISFPSRVVYALQRESLLHAELDELQIEMEKLIWRNNDLETRLQKANREFRTMEAMLSELEDEHDEAIVKIEQLESKLKNTKEENLRLQKVHGKLEWTSQSADDSAKTKDPDNDKAYKSSISSGTYRRKPKNTTGTESKSGAPTHTTEPDHTQDMNMNEYLGEQAVWQSVFSSLLSLMVGIIIWEAEDPCMPLVIALYTVVGMSLKTLVQFFYTIKNKPASDAVALLSLNWFILGALTYPTLPRVAHMLLH